MSRQALLEPAPPSSTSRTVARAALGAMLLFTGIRHLTFARREFIAQVPKSLPLSDDTVVVVSGVAELASRPREGRTSARLDRLLERHAATRWAHLGREHAQVAIVVGQRGKPSRLVACEPSLVRALASIDRGESLYAND